MKTWLLIFAILTAFGCVRSKQPISNAGNVSGQTATATPSSTPDDRSPMDLALDVMPVPGDSLHEPYVSVISGKINRGITYEHLKKDSTRYVGQAWGFTGKILEIVEKDGVTMARIGLGPSGAKPIWVQGRFTTDFVEDDRVYVVGTLVGDYTYKSQANWNITIPSIAAVAIMKPSDVKKYK